MIEIIRAGGVGTLLLSRPSKRNAMSMELVEALAGGVTSLNDDCDIGAIILAGEGAGFCAGSDLAMLAGMTDTERMAFEAESGRVARLMAQCPKPVIAAAHGFAIGGGLTLATSCDVVITDTNSRWSLPEVVIGLFPAWGIGSIVVRAGIPAARRLSWGIETLSGAQAFELGLADQLADDVHAAAVALADKLAALPRPQTAAVKRYFAPLMPDRTTDDRANALFMEAAATAEAALSFGRYRQQE